MAIIPVPSFNALAKLTWKIDFEPRQYALRR
jgi:hypothetical protein